MNYKLCTECGNSKPLEMFGPDRRNKNGLRSSCRKCDKVRAVIYYHKNKERKLESTILYNNLNKQKVAAYKKIYYKENKERIDKQRYKVRQKYYQENKERLQAIYKNWRMSNPDKWNSYQANRRAYKLAAIPSWADKVAIEMFYKEARKKSAETGEKYEVDHIVPLKSKIVCGLHCEFNLQVITESENRRKKNSYWPDMPDRRLACP